MRKQYGVVICARKHDRSFLTFMRQSVGLSVLRCVVSLFFATKWKLANNYRFFDNLIIRALSLYMPIYVVPRKIFLLPCCFSRAFYSFSLSKKHPLSF